MESITITIVMLICMIYTTEKRLQMLIIIESVLTFIIYHIDMDIAVYYSNAAMISSFIALVSFNIKTLSSRLYSVIMLIQSMLCFSLLPNWGYTTNELLQSIMANYAYSITILSLVIGVTNCDRYRYSDNNNISGYSFNSDHNGNSDR